MKALAHALAHAAFVAATGAAAPAGADTLTDILGRGGLLGGWAVDCGAPPSLQNPHVDYLPAASGAVSRELYFAAGEAQGIFTIEAAELHDGGMIGIREVVDKLGNFAGLRYDESILLSPDRRRTRTMRSVDSSGRIIIDNGIVVAIHKESVWMNKCGDAGPPRT
jgi:hypothetical protein